MTMAGAQRARLAPIRVGAVRDAARLAWAEGGEFSVPESLADRLRPFRGADGRVAIGAECLVAEAADADAVRRHSAFTDRKPASSRLPFSYRRVPEWLRDLAAGAAGRLGRRRLARIEFPRWPLDLSADFVADLRANAARAGAPTPVMLTHDIDTPEGLRHAAEMFAGIEEAVGARSAHYVVPCDWPVDDGLVRELRDRGHEIGVHGYDHSNWTPFAADGERRARIAAAKPFIERHAVSGYRAPSLLRTQALIEDLRGSYRYDSSIPTSGGLFPVPGNGCASARPFLIEGLLEIPVSMPRDGSLLFLGRSPEQILSAWREAAARIRASGGMINLLTHCETRFSGNEKMLGIYRRFLEDIAQSRDFAFALPSDIASRRAA